MTTTSRARVLATFLVVVGLYGCNKHDNRQGGGTEVERSAEWYEAHLEVLKIDEGKCAGEAPTMTRDQCQNVYSAETNLGVKEMDDAAARNNAAAAPPRQK
jgi:hypothetical protein